MPADVVEGPDRPVAIADDEHRLAGHRHGDGVAGRRQIVGEGDEDPGSPEQALTLQGEEGVAGISGGRQSRGDRTGAGDRRQRLGAQDLFQ